MLRLGFFSLVLLLLFVPSAFAGNPPGHWSFPGDIASHLRNTHGINPAGMSYEQMLITHDRSHQSGFSTRRVARPSFRIFRRR